MSSKVWKATTSHTEENPQLCGLTGNPIMEGDDCLFLTCSGDQAIPGYQISEVGTEQYQWRGRTKTRKLRETPEGKSFRSVPTGRFRCKRRTCAEEFDYYRKWCGCRAPVSAIFKWQEQRGERWHDVTVWEKAVHAASAVALGFKVPTSRNGEYVMTVANKGARTDGYAHTVAQTPETALADLARAAMDPEELGEVAPEGVRAPDLSEDAPAETHADGCVDLDCKGCDSGNDPSIERFRLLDLD